jgi:predicted transcriptional regulator
MGEVAPGRVALMSIRPEFANAILSGSKSVEFRKRPVAEDVSHVLIYATLPVGSLLGWFAIRGQATKTPTELWKKFSRVGGISKEKFFDYYNQKQFGTGIMVGATEKFEEPLPLAELGKTVRPPQSFQYLTDAQAAKFFTIAGEGQAVDRGI